MLILGVYDGHNCNAALVQDGSVVRAVEEERFSRVKNHDSRNNSLTGPVESIKYCLNGLANPPDVVALAIEEPAQFSAASLDAYRQRGRVASIEWAGETYHGDKVTAMPLTDQWRRVRKTLSCLPENFSVDPTAVMYVPHHLAHAASAYFTAGRNRALVFTADGKGDRLSGATYLGDRGQLLVRDETSYLHSLGHFYAAVTVVCGFRAIRHEGKITAMAGVGMPNPGLVSALGDLIHTHDGRIAGTLNDGFELGPYPHGRFDLVIDRVRKLCAGFSPVTVAASAQSVLEDTVVRYVRHHVRATDCKTVVLSGGIFANVRLNARICADPDVEYVDVHPAMSDSGLGVGAALSAYYENHAYIDNQPLADVFLGPEFTAGEVETALRESGLRYERVDAPERWLARILASSGIVARFSGRCEYGPRALGNRSILAEAVRPDLPAELNRALSRSAVMPFAPVMMRDDAQELLIGTSVAPNAARFMTVAFACTDAMRAQYPAVVHTDGTARVQVVDITDTGMVRLMQAYRALSGRRVLLNTSLNLHEEPLVLTPGAAIRSFRSAGLDALQLGPFVALGET